MASGECPCYESMAATVLSGRPCDATVTNKDGANTPTAAHVDRATLVSAQAGLALDLFKGLGSAVWLVYSAGHSSGQSTSSDGLVSESVDCSLPGRGMAS